MPDIVSTQDVINFFSGIVTGIIAAYAYELLISIRQRSALKSLEGLWLEKIDGKLDQRFSFGTFSFSFSDKRFHYDGTSYLNNLEPYYEWKSISLDFEKGAERIFYIYRVCLFTTPANEHHGFGVMNLRRCSAGNDFRAYSGYFLDAEKKGSAPRHVTYYAAQDVAKKFNILLDEDLETSRKALIEVLVKAHWDGQQ
jgi:hypothetical protein